MGSWAFATPCTAALAAAAKPAVAHSKGKPAGGGPAPGGS